MNYKLALTITSFISIVLFASHWADEVSRAMEPATTAGIWGIVILVVWLYGTLALNEWRWAYIITLVGGIFGLGVLVLHMSGPGYIAKRIPANSAGAFFWAWTLIVLGVTSSMSAILSARGLWSTRRAPTR
jgi:hypothetical protein